MSTVEQILKKLRGMRSEANLAGMARYGIRTDNALGVPLGVLRPMAKELRLKVPQNGPRGTRIDLPRGRPRALRGHGNHELALELWDTGIREARVLAFLIDDPKQVTSAQMERWVRDFDSWDVCDGCLIHLFRKSPLAWSKAPVWAKRRAEFVRRAGFALMATLAVHEKSETERLRTFLPIIEAGADDKRNFVKKAVVWARKNVTAALERA